MGKMKNEHNVLVGKPERRRPLEIPRLRWKDNITMDLTELGCEDVNWIHLAQDRDQWQGVMNAVMNLQIP